MHKAPAQPSQSHALALGLVLFIFLVSRQGLVHEVGVLAQIRVDHLATCAHDTHEPTLPGTVAKHDPGAQDQRVFESPKINDGLAASVSETSGQEGASRK